MVCQNYSPPDGFQPGDLQRVLQAAAAAAALEGDGLRQSVPFVACGDLSGWDADQSYSLPPDYVALPPLQPPTAPAYADAKARQRAKGQSGRRKGAAAPPQRGPG